MQFLGQLTLVALLVLGGVGLTLQAAVNARLREAVGSPVWGALVSFLVGGIVVVGIAAFGQESRSSN